MIVSPLAYGGSTAADTRYSANPDSAWILSRSWPCWMQLSAAGEALRLDFLALGQYPSLHATCASLGQGGAAHQSRCALEPGPSWQSQVRPPNAQISRAGPGPEADMYRIFMPLCQGHALCIRAGQWPHIFEYQYCPSGCVLPGHVIRGHRHNQRHVLFKPTTCSR